MAFEQKVKEPDLSPEMQEIIEKTHRENDSNGYDDIDRYKYLIMKILTENQDILKTLHNSELEKNNKINNIINGDVYRNINIFSFLKIPDTQSTVKNFICFEVDDIEQSRYNEGLIKKNIIFRTISHEDDFITDWGIARQDLLALIIKNEFDWTNIFGNHIVKTYDKGRVAESGYYYREFIYEVTVPNNLVNKAKNSGKTYEQWKYR